MAESAGSACGAGVDRALTMGKTIRRRAPCARAGREARLPIARGFIVYSRNGHSCPESDEQVASTSMQRLPVFCASLISVLSFGPALAEPLLLARVNADPPPAAAVDAARPAAPPAFSGGLLDFLFGGGMHGASWVPGSDVPEPSAQSNGIDLNAAEAGAHPAMDPRFARQIVMYPGSEPAGTIIINTQERFLYLVEGSGRAVRYGIGVGRPGFRWAGVKQITMKREWPEWRPPDEMLRRRPDLPRYMPGGPENPLGARALYLGSSLYRIHGSNEPWTIGTAVSSGCIRMRNEDVIDLYDRVKVGTKVMVI
jgi:lipoprotein-anchoring transpeptidase ErfK/SrfK